MVLKDFKIKRRTFKKRKLSTIQHKLRVLMKCYTIVGFDIDDDEKTFTFKKSHKINGIRMDDPKCYYGKYEVEEVNDSDDINLRLIVEDIKNKDAYK